MCSHNYQIVKILLVFGHSRLSSPISSPPAQLAKLFQKTPLPPSPTTDLPNPKAQPTKAVGISDQFWGWEQGLG